MMMQKIKVKKNVYDLLHCIVCLGHALFKWWGWDEGGEGYSWSEQDGQG